MRLRIQDARQELRDAIGRWKQTISADTAGMAAEINAVTDQPEAGFNQIYEAIDTSVTDTNRPHDALGAIGGGMILPSAPMSMRAYLRGYTAAFLGYPASLNPHYPESGLQSLLWADGYAACLRGTRLTKIGPQLEVEVSLALAKVSKSNAK